MRPTRKWLAALAVVALVASSGVARADSATDAAVKARIDEGLSLLQKKKYKEARAAFLQAQALEKRSQTLLYLAVASLRAGYPLEAIEYLRQYNEEVPEPPPKLKAIADEALKQAQGMLGHVKVTTAEGAEISVDGKPAGKAPLDKTIDVEPGKHTIKATLEDDTKTQEVTLTAGMTSEVKLAVKPRTPGPPPPPKIKPPTPVPTPQKPDEEPGLLARPASMAPFYIAGGVGIVGITSAIVFGALKYNADYSVRVSDRALGNQNVGRDACTNPPPITLDDVCGTLANNLDRSAKDGRYFAISLGVGLTGLGAAVGWYLFSPKARGTSEEGTTTVTPIMAPGTAGAAVSGSF